MYLETITLHGILVISEVLVAKTVAEEKVRFNSINFGNYYRITMSYTSPLLLIISPSSQLLSVFSPSTPLLLVVSPSSPLINTKSLIVR